ncbi:hypothetical protein CICLE_v10003398mg [Citrus x clementina]|uniref:LysM domain-containing protein n=1 Tax=Citrus clementina TaxID=85681 RepID=V4V0U3_CITCL|nr:hypothetical protein CICLE_v10003398mg [Citrus x clementina]
MASYKNSVFRKLALVLALLLIVSMAESSNFAVGLVKSPPTCDSAYGAQEGDTCSDVSKKFKLSNELFLAINPNINCDAVFVGQWLCIVGSA